MTFLARLFKELLRAQGDIISSLDALEYAEFKADCAFYALSDLPGPPNEETDSILGVLEQMSTIETHPAKMSRREVRRLLRKTLVGGIPFSWQ